MRDWTRICGCLLAMLLGLQTQAQDTADAASGDAEIDADALSVLESMADYLVAAETFAYRAEYAFDVVQDSGVKVEFGASRKTLVSRPDRLHVESQRRDGLRATVVFDGEHIWAYAPEQNVYAQTEQVGDLDTAIQFAVAELRMKAPMADLLSPDLHEILTKQLTRAYYLGETVLVGVDCHHLLLSNGYADFQMWIRTGDKPLPQRIVITYREETGQPQFRAQFLEWDFAPTVTADKFRFEPPDGAERVRFYVPAAATDLDQENAS
jgi:hypothetical protein